MRLQAIKLAGFKSFVDPTTVAFPSNLCAVVGPNGCGKSNVVDAVNAAQTAGRNYITVASEFLGQDLETARKAS